MSFAKTKKLQKKSELGVSALEFALLLPLLLILLTSVLQTALIVQAKFVVNQAAYAALRSAIVTLPANIKSLKTQRLEPHNKVSLNDPDSAKVKIIQHAAALVLTSISPVYSASLGASTGTKMDASLLAPLGKAVLALSALSGGGNLAEEVVNRAHYAFDPGNTRVEIIPANDQQRLGLFDDHDEITIRVTFRYYLTVPVAARIFGKSYPGSDRGGDSGRYIEITEQYTLQNEGEPLFPGNQVLPGGDIELEEN